MSRPAIRNAVGVVGAAAVLGLAGQLLFFDVGLGINYPIFITALLGAGWALRRPTPSPMHRDLWLAPAAIAFAVFAAIRADATIVTLDLLASLGLTAAALVSFGGRGVGARPFPAFIQLGFNAAGSLLVGAIPAVSAVRHHLPSGSAALDRAGSALPVLRGLLLAIPVALIFVILFAAADAVFARIVEDLFRVDLDLGEFPGRLILASMIGWIAAGSLALAASSPPADTEARADGSAAAPWRLGHTEAVTVLVAVNAVFLAFVALQGAYLFGGLDTIRAAGMSYSEYARRGFFELVAVAMLAGGLIVLLERITRRRSRLFIGASIGLVLLTGVVLASAGLRLRLYQEAYGWTELRLYVLATIGLLGAGLLALAITLVTDRVRWIGHALLAAGLAIGFGLSIIGPARFITEQNVARLVDPTLVAENGSHGLDVFYAFSLGDDAVRDLVRALPLLEEPEAGYLREQLDFRRDELRQSSGLNAWQAWNAGREQARSALEAADLDN
ncbi:MAG: DUF4153 domain-containing protein [Candidatus Limnocylindria bacterium]